MHLNEVSPSMKNILFVANLKKDKELVYSKDIINTLALKDVKVFVDAEELFFVDKTELVSPETINDVDLMIVLGGDGTILTYARKYRKYNIPIMGINLGRIGALAVAELTDYSTYIDKYLNEEYVIINHLALEGKIIHTNKKVNKFNKNQVLVKNKQATKVAKKRLLNAYNHLLHSIADGIHAQNPG